MKNSLLSTLGLVLSLLVTPSFAVPPTSPSDQTVRAPRAATLSAPYDKLLIDDVVIAYDEQSPYQGLKPAQIERIKAATAEALRKTFGERLTIVAEPGPGVLLIRPAITDILAEEKTKHFWSYTPFGFAKGKIDTATGKNFVLLSATVEVEVLDSDTGQQLAAIADLTAGDVVDGDYRELSFRTLVAKVCEWTQVLVSDLAGPIPSATAALR